MDTNIIGSTADKVGSWLPSVTSILTYIILSGVVIWAIWEVFFVPKRKYKNECIIDDITGGGFRQTKTRCGWIYDKRDNTGYFGLKSDKKAFLKHPPLFTAKMTKKGAYSYHLVKFGEGPLDYAVLDFSHLRNEDGLPARIPLSDMNWGAWGIKKAQEKNTLSGWWNENKGAVITFGAIAFALVVILATINWQKENLSQQVAMQGEMNKDYVTISENFVEAIDKLSEILGTQVKNEVVPPPGFT